MALPLPSAIFDVKHHQLRIRNVTRIADALKEAYRVLSPADGSWCWSSARIPNDLLQWLYDRYSSTSFRHGADRGERSRQLSVPGRIDPEVSGSGKLATMIRQGRLFAGQVPQPDHGRGGPAFGVEDLGAGPP